MMSSRRQTLLWQQEDSYSTVVRYNNQNDLYGLDNDNDDDDDIGDGSDNDDGENANSSSRSQNVHRNHQQQSTASFDIDDILNSAPNSVRSMNPFEY